MNKNNIMRYEPLCVLTEGDIRCLFDTQAQLNAEYHPDWRERFSESDYLASAIHEFAGEAMKEMEGTWKFFGNCKVDRVKAAFELVDTVCFLLSSLMLRPGFEHESKPDVWVIRDKSYAELFVMLTLRLSAQTMNNYSSFATFMHYALLFVGITANEFMTAYMKKVELNRHRAANGAVDGTYDKSKEPDLTLEISGLV